MSDFEDKINSILSNPAEMEKITRLASQLMGGAAPTQEPDVQDPPASGSSADGWSLDAGMVKKLGSLMSSGSQDDKTALLHAIGPYMSPDRRARLEKAIRFAKLAHVARAVFGGSEPEAGGGKNV